MIPDDWDNSEESVRKTSLFIQKRCCCSHENSSYAEGPVDRKRRGVDQRMEIVFIAADVISPTHRKA